MGFLLMVNVILVCVVNIMLGLITPPYGLLVFVMASFSGQTLNAIEREVLSFLCAMLAALGLISFFPGLSLWLPRLFSCQG